MHKWALLVGPAGRRAHQLQLEWHQHGLPFSKEAVWGKDHIHAVCSTMQRSHNIPIIINFSQYITQQNFISKGLEVREASITKLSDDGEKLLTADHPGKNVIEVDNCHRRKLVLWICLIVWWVCVWEYLWHWHSSFIGTHGSCTCRLERIPQLANLWGEPPQTHGRVPQSEYTPKPWSHFFLISSGTDIWYLNTYHATSFVLAFR